MNASPLITLMLEAKALKFGDFTTKSGRNSPYFFNTGAIASGRQLGALADLYCNAVLEHYPEGVGHLYGPAYKGISLSVLLADRLYQRTGNDCLVTYNRKKAKGHGEGGVLIGAPLVTGQSVTIVEDILTGGTSIRESIELLKTQQVRVSGAVIGIDRMERGLGQMSAREEIEREFDFPIHSIANVTDVLDYLNSARSLSAFDIDEQQRFEIQKSVRSYLSEFGALS